jgi:DNA adenine methylase
MKPSPFVKWAGGKAQLLSQLEPFFPAGFERYVEPFVGGGAVFFHFYRQGRLSGKPSLLIDSLEDLIDCYRAVQNRVEDLIGELQRHEANKHDKEYFYEVRAWDRAPDYAQRDEIERAARFLFLNRICYNGLYRVNRRGEFNVPFGRHRNPTICAADNLRAVSQALQGVVLLAGDFTLCLETAAPGDFVYLDPPYDPLSDTANFTSYTSNDFGAADQQRLAELFRSLDRRGCQVMLSNSSTQFIRDLYAGYEQIEVQANRAISSKGNARGPIPELLVVNYSLP